LRFVTTDFIANTTRWRFVLEYASSNAAGVRGGQVEGELFDQDAKLSLVVMTMMQFETPPSQGNGSGWL
jgi:hypothetical protein